MRLRDRANQSCGGCRTRERGFTLILGLIIIIVMTTFSTALVFNSAARHVEAKIASERALALALAEGAASLLMKDLDADDRGPVKDAANYDLVGKTYVREYVPFDPDDGSVRVEITYLADAGGKMTPVVFANRLTADELYDRIHAVVIAIRPGVKRTIDIDMEQQFVMFDGAITSDAVPTEPACAADKTTARGGHVVFDDKGRLGQFWLNGSILSNGAVFGTNGEMTEANAKDSITFAGSIQSNLAGTVAEIPDYTSVGSQDQLFEFNRFIAAARAGAGAEYTDLDDFVSDMRAANAKGVFLEGIRVISIDKTKYKIDSGDLPGGINIHGTLLFNFEVGTPPMHEFRVLCDVNVNPADLTGFDAGDPETYTSGYGKMWWNENLRAHKFDITPGGFRNFAEDDDMPAIMFNTGIVNQCGSTNICGLIYGPSLVEFENAFGGTQYYCGAVLGGSGIYIGGHESTGTTIISFDRATINKLATQSAKGKGVQLIGWKVHD